MRALALAIYAAGLAVALVTSTVTSVSPTRSLREDCTTNCDSTPTATTKVPTPTDNSACDFYHCRPRSMSATTLDCQLWCNNESGQSACAKSCKCPSDAVEAGGLFCDGLCLATLRCARGRIPRCNAYGALQCQQL